MYRESSTPGPLLVVTSGKDVSAHDRRTGRRVWTFTATEPNAGRNGMRTVVEGERVIVAYSGAIESGWSAKVPAFVTALDYPTGRVVWQQRIELGVNVALFSASVLVDSGQVVVATGHSLQAYTLEDGRLQWSERVLTQAHESQSVGLALPGQSVQVDRM